MYFLLFFVGQVRFCSLPGPEKTARKLFGYVLSQPNHPQIIQTTLGNLPQIGAKIKVFESTNQYFLSSKTIRKNHPNNFPRKRQFWTPRNCFSKPSFLNVNSGGGILSVKRWGKDYKFQNLYVFSVCNTSKKLHKEWCSSYGARDFLQTVQTKFLVEIGKTTKETVNHDIPFPQNPCMVHLPTFTMKINEM